MPKYLINYPNGPSGQSDRLPQRLAALGGKWDAESSTVEFPDSDNPTGVEYVNAIAAEYGGTASNIDEPPADDEPTQGKLFRGV